MRCSWCTHPFLCFLNLLEDNCIQNPLKRGFEHYKPCRLVQLRLAFFVGCGEETDDCVHIGGCEGTPRLIVDNLLDVAVLEGELLKVFSVADIKPRIRGDETERPFRIEEGKPVKIEVDVEVAFGIQFVGDSGGRIIRCDVPFAFVAKEARKGLIHRAGKFRLVHLLVFAL